MLIKTLVTGFVTSAAAVGMVTAAAAGVSSVTASSAPAITPVVWDTPLPQLPAPDLQAPLTQTLSALAGPGSFSGKAPYIQGGIGRIESIAADRAYNNAAREGKFPLDKLVTRRYKLEQINEACDALVSGEILGRAIIEY